MLIVGLFLSLLTLNLIHEARGGCFLKHAEWEQGPPKVTHPNKNSNKLLVNWATIINDKDCAEKYIVWAWKDGQTQRQGRSTTITDVNTLQAEIDIEPCLWNNIRVQLFQKGKTKESDIARFNTGTINGFNSADIKIGYYKDPQTGQYDLSKASLKFGDQLLEFATCIKHIEVIGTEDKGVRGFSGVTTSRTPARGSQTTPSPVSRTEKPKSFFWGQNLATTNTTMWKPYGTGRQSGGLGVPPVGTWATSMGHGNNFVHGKQDMPSQKGGHGHNGCHESGREYPGGGLQPNPSITGVISAEQCQVKCVERQGCKFFTWIGATHPDASYRNTCWLKSSQHKFRPCQSCVSGPRNCVCMEIGKEYHGGGVSQSPQISGIRSAEECQDQCQQRPECRYFTWLGPNYDAQYYRNTCWLKKNRVSPRPCSECISGPKSCGSGPVTARPTATPSARPTATPSARPTAKPTARPTVSSGGGGHQRPSGGWSYSPSTIRPHYPHTTNRPPSNSGASHMHGDYGDWFHPGQAIPGFWKLSLFGNAFPRELDPSSSAKSTPLVTKTLPANYAHGVEVEVVVSVEPCQLYTFGMRIVNKNNEELGRVTGVKLPILANIQDYIPPPLTSIIGITFSGNSDPMIGNFHSSIPPSCIPSYLEAVDTFANRLENIANLQSFESKSIDSHRSGIQGHLEITQQEALAKMGCKCTSPHLEFRTTDPALMAKEGDLFGHYHYQGMYENHPYYMLDKHRDGHHQEVRGGHRHKRFIGRIDPTTTTTQRPWNFGTHRPNCATVCPMDWKPVCGSDGIMYSNECKMNVAACQDGRRITVAKRCTGWGDCNKQKCMQFVASGGATTQRPKIIPTTQNPSGGQTAQNHIRGQTTQRVGNQMSTHRPSSQHRGYEAATSAPPGVNVPSYLFWCAKVNRWVFSGQLGGTDSKFRNQPNAKVGSQANPVAKCPADPENTGWQVKERTWTDNANIQLVCHGRG